MYSIPQKCFVGCCHLVRPGVTDGGTGGPAQEKGQLGHREGLSGVLEPAPANRANCYISRALVSQVL